MKLRFALLAIGLPLLALGGEGLYHAVSSHSQQAMTCDQFARRRPRGQWVRLTGCTLDYDAPGYREAKGQIAEIYFPVRITGQPRGAPAPLLAATRDAGALAIVQGTIGGGRQPDQEALTVMMLRVVTALKAAREVEGMTRAGVIELLLTRRSLTSFPVPLADGYAVVDLHKRPDFVLPGVEAAAGLLAVLLFLVAGRARRGAKGGAAELPLGKTPVAEGLPAMLLLNLEPSAGPEAIEHAPPLGLRADVQARLAAALGTLKFDKVGRGSVKHADAALDFEIGTTDPVWSITVRASGPGALGAVRELAATEGWRVYVPKRGAFLGALDSVDTKR
jgi:hypothetical protein